MIRAPRLLLLRGALIRKECNMIDFIYNCLDFVFFPMTSTSELVLIPFFLLVVVLVIRLFSNLLHIGGRK